MIQIFIDQKTKMEEISNRLENSKTKNQRRTQNSDKNQGKNGSQKSDSRGKMTNQHENDEILN